MHVRLAAMAVTVLIILTGLVCSVWSASENPPIKLSEVASASDLAADVEAKLSEIKAGLVSPDKK